MQNKTIYKKAVAEVVLFDNRDVITTSGEAENGGTTTGCPTWSNQNGTACYFGLTET